MSSVSNSTSSQTSGSKPSAVEAARQSLHQHLKKTATFIRLMDTLGQVFTWIAGALGLWLLACLVDHWLLPLPSALRWFFWFVGVAGTAAWLVVYLIPLVFRRVSLVYAAQRIEHLVPEFKNGLISWLELENLPDNGVPKGVMAALAYRAKRFIGDQDPSATVDTSPLIKLVATVLLLATLMVVYTMISPKSVGTTGKRILMPWAALASPSRVEILEVKPGSIEITQGKPLELDVEVRGLRTGEPVFVRYSTTDGQLVDRRQELGAVTEGFRYAGLLTTDKDGVQQELDYWVEAGDASKGPWRVRLNPLPTVVVESIQLDFPEYTRLPSQVVDGGQVAEAVEGTTATIVALGNQPMKRAVLEINPEVDERQELIRAAANRSMQVEDRRLSVDWLMQLNEKRENPTRINYRIRGYNQRLEANPSPIIHTMSVTADLPPEITLVGPESRTLKVAPTSVVDIEVRANDPDYGLSKIKLQVRKNSAVAGETTLLDDSGVVGQQVRVTKLDLRRLNAVPGDRIQLIAAAQDNRHDPVTKEWAPGKAISEPLLLEVVGPQQNPDVPPAADQEKPESDPESTNATQQNRDQQSQNSGQSASQGENSNRGDDSGGSSSSGEGKQDGAAGEGQQGQQPGGQQSGSQAGGESSQQESGGQSGGSNAGGAGSTQETAESAQPSSSGSTGNQRTGAGSSEGSDSGSRGDGEATAAAGQSGGEDGQTTTDSSGNAGPQGRRDGGDSGSAGDPNGRQGGQELSDGEVIERVQEMMQRGNQADQRSGSSNDAGSSQDSSTGGRTGQEQSQGRQSSEQNANGSSEGQSGSPDSQASQSDSSQQSDSPSGTQQTDSQPAADQPAGDQRPGGGDPSTGEGGGQRPQDTAGSNSSPENQPASSSDSSKSGDQSGQQSGSQDASDSGTQSTDVAQGNQSGGESSSAEGSQSSGDNSSSSSSSSQAGSESSQDQSQSSSGGAKSSDSSKQSSSPSQSAGQQGNQTGGDAQSESSQTEQDASSSGEADAGAQNQDSGAQNQDSGTASGGNQTTGEQDATGSQPEPGQSDESGSGGSSTQPQSEGNGQQQQAGDQQASDSQQPASPSPGSSSQSSQSGSQSSSSSSSSQSSSTQGSASSGSSSNQGRTSGGGASADGSGPGGDAAQADEINQDYADRTTQLVLDYLERQKDQPDPELLKELNWSEEDLQKFVDKWSKARDLATSGNEQDREQWQEKLRDLGLRPPTLGARRGMDINDSFQQMQDSGSRVNYPSSLRRKYEAFQRALQNRKSKDS